MSTLFYTRTQTEEQKKYGVHVLSTYEVVKDKDGTPRFQKQFELECLHDEEGRPFKTDWEEIQEYIDEFNPDFFYENFQRI